jgi:alpha-galactosidase
MLKRLNERFPQVSFQNCAGGGGRLDLGILRYFHHTEISDWARPPRDIKIFNGILSQLPPEIQLRIAGTEVCEHIQDSDIISKLHSVMQGRMIFRGIAPSLDELMPPLLEIVRQRIELYKNEIRPILTGKCNVYLHATQSGVLNASAWSANEYALPDGNRAFAVIHKLSAFSEDRYCLRFSGLRSERNYRVYLDRRNDFYETTGKELMQTGITLEFGHVFDSELILVKAISPD